MKREELVKNAVAAFEKLFSDKEKFDIDYTILPHNGVCVGVAEIVHGERWQKVSRDGGKTFVEETYPCTEYYPIGIGGLRFYGIENPDTFEAKVRKWFERFI